MSRSSSFRAMSWQEETDYEYHHELLYNSLKWTSGQLPNATDD